VQNLPEEEGQHELQCFNQRNRSKCPLQIIPLL